MNSLQKYLTANGLFSFLSGLSLIFLHKQAARLFELENSAPFWIIGMGLPFFAFTVFLEAKKQRPIFVLFIIGQDLLWVAASILLLALDPFNISATGNFLTGLIALIVLFFAIGQAKFLAQADRVSNDGSKQFTYEKILKTHKSATWNIVSDVANYHIVAPNIDQVAILSGQGKGMIRKCFHGRDRWTETCTRWNEEEQYTFEVNTHAPDYPYPLKSLKGTWKLEAITATQTKIIMIFDFKYRRKIHTILLHPFMKKKFGAICDELFENWHKLLEEQKSGSKPVEV